MPNWCVGKLKVRGKREDLINFIKNGLQPLYADHNSNINEEINDNFIWLHYDDTCYIKHTYRGFIDSLNVELEKDDNTNPSIIILNARFAWAIQAEQLLEICKTYNVDMNIYAYERGMEFNLHIEIVDNKIVHDDEITFGNYIWECPEPDIGG
jgi:hypothetical protein